MLIFNRVMTLDLLKKKCFYAISSEKPLEFYKKNVHALIYM